MIVVPIGIDCGTAMLLRRYGLRDTAYPFDWVVNYSGIAEILENNFETFIPKIECSRYVNHATNTWFVHYDFPRDTEKYERRIKKFMNMLETCEEEIIFFRKGHSPHHHAEYNEIVFNDIEEAEKLDLVLKEKYPKLKYKIMVVLVCGKWCFDANREYTHASPNIKIYNIATDECDNDKFESLFRQIFSV